MCCFTVIGEQGIMSISAVCAHISQILIDGFIATYWSDKFDKYDKLCEETEPLAMSEHETHNDYSSATGSDHDFNVDVVEKRSDKKSVGE